MTRVGIKCFDLFMDATVPKVSKAARMNDEQAVEESRLEMLKSARVKSGLSLDFWVDFTEGLGAEVIRTLVDRAHMLEAEPSSADPCCMCHALSGVEDVNGSWLRARITGEGGEQARIARHTGISADKLTGILAGTRRVQAREAPKLYSYFMRRRGDGGGVRQETLAQIVSQLGREEQEFLIKSAIGLLSPFPRDLSYGGAEPT